MKLFVLYPLELNKQDGKMNKSELIDEFSKEMNIERMKSQEGSQ